MVRTMLLNIQDADIIVCNAYKEDYKGVRGRFINGEENIKVYLKSIIESPAVRERPLYIVLEELATIKDKDNIKMIKELLCIARHYNIIAFIGIRIFDKAFHNKHILEVIADITNCITLKHIHRWIIFKSFFCKC